MTAYTFVVDPATWLAKACPVWIGRSEFQISVSAP